MNHFSATLIGRRTLTAAAILLTLLALTACGRGSLPSLREPGDRTVTITASLEAITTNDPGFSVDGLPLEAVSVKVTRGIDTK